MNIQPYSTSVEKRNRVRSMLTPQRNKWAVELILTAAARMGQQKFEKDDPRFEQAAKDLIDIILPTVSHLSQDEVEHVMALGACGELGDAISINSRTISGWFKTYMKDVRPKIAAKHKQSQNVIRELPPPEINKDFFLREAKQAAKDYDPADIELTPPRIFDIYVEYGLITNPEEKLKKHETRAVIEARKEKAEMPPKSKSIASIYSESMQRSEGDRILSWAKRLSVAEYYDWLRLRGE